MKKNAEMKMLVVLFHTVVFIMAACSPIAPTTIPSPLPTETLKATATLSPTITLTPEPTATFTETPLPDIGLSKVIVLNPDGSPLLTPWGSVKIDVQKSFDDFPQIETLEAQLGVLGKGWTPEFIGKWHSYLEQATVGGVPVVVPFDPNTVCTNVTWNTDYSDYGKIGTLDEWFINPSSCQAGTFPTRFVGSFYDNRPRIIGAAGETLRYPIIGVTFALWNPDLKKNGVADVCTCGSRQ